MWLEPRRLLLGNGRTGGCKYYYLRIENAEGYVLIAMYLFIYLQNSKSIEPNCMKFGGMIGYYPGTS